ncbi:hypothetical protein V9L05_19345 [Bernardetia sp. Wsw4-3y2]|uniref:hypothetical protein n=1 Tax=Bernardetia sp. Wsw4-3y2 TaxID=3127471 RepID=UPI0030CE46F7
MKKNLIITVLVLLLIPAYLAGIFFPVHKSFIPHLINKDLSVNDLITRLVQSGAAVATFTSAFVALFRDELRRIFLEKHDISISFIDETNKITEITDTEGETDNTVVKEYICRLEFKNTGNVAEKNAEISMQNITTKRVSDNTVKYDIPLVWENNQTSTRIPIKGCRHFTLFSIASSQELEENDEFDSAPRSNTTIPPKLKLTNDIEYTSEIKLEITYLISYDNNRHDEFTISLDWDGKWQNRVLEMKDHVKVSFKKK